MKKLLILILLAAIGYGIYCYASQEATEVETTDEIVEETWLTYENKDLGVSFSYPSNYELITDEIHLEYTGGLQWYKIELADENAPETPGMIFEVNADGYGPFWPDKYYDLEMTTAGKLEITSETIEEVSEYSDDGHTLIMTGIPTETDSYSIRFGFYEGGEDHEDTFKEILTSFNFS